MDQSTRKKIAGLAMVSVLTLVSGALTAVGVSGQTTPSWPKIDKKEKYVCKGNYVNCDSCQENPAPEVGCTATLEGTAWPFGVCEKDESLGDGLGCTRTNFACGAALECESGDPTGNNCPTNDYCHDYEGPGDPE